MSKLMSKVLCGAIALAVAAPAVPCTTFVVDGKSGALFARNYDFEFGEALIVVNPRGLQRTSAAPPISGQSPARWQSLYGSLTFNQFGVGFPTGGMNERGLVVELLWLDGTRYPQPDSRPVVTTLEFIQYLLDRAATLPEALAAAAAVRIVGRTPLHFLVSDSAGRTASIEFLDGKLVAHHGESLPVRALANDRYDRSLAALKSNATSVEGTSSLSRFVRAATQSGGERTVEQAFMALDNVAQPGATHWQIVYELSPAIVHWRTSANAELRTLRLAQLSFDCGDGVQLADVNDGRGDARERLRPYRRQEDEAQLRTAYRKFSLFKGDPAKEAAEDAAATEARMRCA